MALKALIKKDEFEKLSEVLQKEYTNVDGTEEYTLTVDDADYKKKLGEFRSNNINMKQELEKLEKLSKKYDGVDPDKYAEMQAKIQELEDKKMIDAGKIDELVEQRTERMRADFEGSRKALEAKAKEASDTSAALNERLSTVLIDKEVQSAVSSVGSVRKGAMEDILARARRTWVLQDGHPVPMEGETVKYGKDGKSPMSMQEWAEGLVDEAPYLFEGNSGSGSRGNDKGGDGKGDKSIAGSDRSAFSKNLESIAKGETKVDIHR